MTGTAAVERSGMTEAFTYCVDWQLEAADGVAAGPMERTTGSTEPRSGTPAVRTEDRRTTH